MGACKEDVWFEAGKRGNEIDIKANLPAESKPNMAANATSNTGEIGDTACFNDCLPGGGGDTGSSANSITRIPFFTTIPASPTIPKPVKAMETSIPVKLNLRAHQ